MTLSRDTIDETIRRLFAETFAATSEGAEELTLEADTVLLDTGLDSLGFAILVTRLEEDLGYDPFTISEDAFYPTTFGEFLDFYTNTQPK